MKILHLTIDSKFINHSNVIFEYGFKNSNYYLVLEPIYKKQSLADLNELPNLRKMTFHQFNVAFGKKEFLKYDMIFLHGFHYCFAKKVLKYPSIRFYLIGWGGEIYQNPLILGQETKLISRFSLKKILYSVLRTINYAIPLNKSKEYLIVKKAFQYLDKAAYLPSEYKYLSEKKLISESCKYFDFKYYALDYFFKNIESKPLGNSIIVGKSSKKEENHLQVLEILIGLDLDKKVYVPSSTGDLRNYREKLKKEFRKYKGDVVFLDKFLELEKFIEILQKANTLIIGSKRQLGLGTILISLYLGHKVYLYRENPIFNYLQGLGMTIFSLKDLNSNFDKELEQSHVQENLKILKENFSIEKISEKLIQSVL